MNEKSDNISKIMFFMSIALIIPILGTLLITEIFVIDLYYILFYNFLYFLVIGFPLGFVQIFWILREMITGIDKFNNRRCIIKKVKK